MPLKITITLRTGTDAGAKIAALDALDTEVDVVVHTYRRTENDIPADG